MLQVKIGALVAGVMDVAGASPRRFFFEVLRHFASKQMEADRLAYFASAEGRDDLSRYNHREGTYVLPSVTSACLSLHPLSRLLTFDANRGDLLSMHEIHQRQGLDHLMTYMDAR